MMNDTFIKNQCVFMLKCVMCILYNSEKQIIITSFIAYFWEGPCIIWCRVGRGRMKVCPINQLTDKQTSHSVQSVSIQAFRMFYLRRF